jgi:uncharacterized protein YceK
MKIQMVLSAIIQLSGCATVRRELGNALISQKAEIQLGEQIAAQIDSTQKKLNNAAAHLGREPAL